MAPEHSTHHKPQHRVGRPHSAPYRQLLLMIALSFISMYALMYAMVDRFANVYMSMNQVYMAGLMTAPMVLIELAIMRSMYSDRRLNVIAAAASVTVLVSCWTLIRQQTAIDDEQFLRSMIPHHAGAILMCEEAPLQDVEIRTLCRNVVASQQSEIDRMRIKLNQLAP
jgi:uncharacterized protein (DUF305 family)